MPKRDYIIQRYEIDELAKEDSWHISQIVANELLKGFDNLSDIEPAVTIYGSAKIQPNDKQYSQTEEIAYWLGKKGFSIITGGGAGVMEAANKGALRAKVTSIGLNIDLPKKQPANLYTTKSMTFTQFFVRKIMLFKYATAFVAMPGGLGTLDELTEVLNLIHTEKIKPFPVVLFNSEYWGGFIDWLRDSVLASHFISTNEIELLRVCDYTDEVVTIVETWHTKRKVTGKGSLSK